MHLFKNKSKDVKQFLSEMKANKTNNSSNMSSLQRSNKSVASSSHSQSSHQKHFVGNTQKLKFQPRRSNSINSIDSLSSNRSNNASINSQTRYLQQAPKYYPLPSQPFDQRHIYHQANHIMNDHPNNQTHYASIPTHQISQFPQKYIHEYSNSPAPYYVEQRKINSLNDPRNSFKHSYQNMSQPLRSFNQFHEPDFIQQIRGRHNQLDSSFHSNSTNYQKNQQYQNLYESSHQSNRYPRKSQQITQTKQPSNKFTHQNFNQRKINNSQQFTNQRFEQLKPFTSQVNIPSFQVSNFYYQMQQIAQAEPGLSTQKNTPGKISEFFSKRKNPDPHFKQTPISKVTDSKVFEIIEDHISPLNSNLKKDENQIFNGMNDTKKVTFYLKKMKFNNLSVQTQNQQRTKKFEVSEQDKIKLERSLHQLNQSSIEINELFKETEILLSNIERGSIQFNKRMKSNNLFLKYMDKDSEKQSFKTIQYEKQKKDETLKKRNIPTRILNLQNQRTFKKEGRMIQFEI